MGNKVIQAILNEKIEAFRFSFENTSKDIFWDEERKALIHPEEYGTYREAATKDFLRLVIPHYLEINHGFLITSHGDISTQCDIIIFDRNRTPLIENSERQKFFPIETVCAIGEVKSTLDRGGLKVAINKLARSKQLRERISSPTSVKRDHPGKFDPINYPYDHVFSFLICNRFDFKVDDIQNDINEMYEVDIKPWQKHNLVLSINDGLLAYVDNNKKTLMYPFLAKEGTLKNRFIKPDAGKHCHFQFASSYIFMGTSSSSIYFPDMSNYLTDFIGGLNFDQK